MYGFTESQIYNYNPYAPTHVDQKSYQKRIVDKRSVFPFAFFAKRFTFAEISVMKRKATEHTHFIDAETAR